MKYNKIEKDNLSSVNWKKENLLKVKMELTKILNGKFILLIHISHCYVCVHFDEEKKKSISCIVD